MRRRATGLTAMRLTGRTSIRLVSNDQKEAQIGDIVISTASSILDVLSPAQYARDFEAVHPEQLVLTPVECTRLDETLGLGATRTPADLCAAVERLASLRFGDIRIPFTPGQLAEIAHRASKRGRTVEAEMAAVVARIQDELFHRGA